jgi:hypothetical protein
MLVNTIRIKILEETRYVRALPNDMRAPDIAPLIPPVSEVSTRLSRHRILLFWKFSLVPEYMVKLAAPRNRTIQLGYAKG